MLKRGGAPAPNVPAGASTATLPGGQVLEVVDVPEVPVEIPRHKGNGNPKIRLGSTPKFRFYSRASNYGKAIEDEHGLTQWKLRAVMFGATRNPALIARGQALEAFEDKADPDRHKALREEWNTLAGEAIDRARTADRAIRGTALHTLSERADRGDDLSYLDPVTAAVLEQWRRIMSLFVIHGTEAFVVDDVHGVAGTYDRLVSPREVLYGPDGEVRLTPDDRVILDLKTGSTTKYWAAAYCVQQAVYATGTPYVHVDEDTAAQGDTGRRPWPGGIAPHQRWALIPHIPLESPQDAGLMWVNLERGRELLDLAATVKAAQKYRDLFEEYTLPGPATVGPSLEERLDELVGRLASAPDMATVDALYVEHAGIWTADCTEVVTARLATLNGVAA